MEKCGRVQQAIDDNIMLDRKEAVSIPIAFPGQQQLREHALVFVICQLSVLFHMKHVK